MKFDFFLKKSAPPAPSQYVGLQSRQYVLWYLDSNFYDRFELEWHVFYFSFNMLDI
jgi:hypothetical protein